MEDTQVTELMYVTFRNRDLYEKFKNGELQSKNGLRNKDGKYVPQVDIESCEKESQHKSEIHNEHFVKRNVILDACKDGVKEALENFVYDLIYDKEKRKLLFDRVNALCPKNIAPSFKSAVKKINFTKDVIQAVFSNEEPKALNISKENINLLPTTNSSDVIIEKMETFSDETKTIFLNEEEALKLKLLMMILYDLAKKYSIEHVRKEELSEEAYLLERKKLEDLFVKEAINKIQMLAQEKNLFFDEFDIKILSGNLLGDNTISLKHISAKES